VLEEEVERVASEGGWFSRCCWTAEDAVVRAEVGTGATANEDSVSGRVGASGAVAVAVLLLLALPVVLELFAVGGPGLDTSCLAAEEMSDLRGGLLASGGVPPPPGADLAGCTFIAAAGVEAGAEVPTLVDFSRQLKGHNLQLLLGGSCDA
jgi:hypothetical protein